MDGKGAGSLDASGMQLREKRNYMMALVTMAAADDDIAFEEREVIEQAAVALNCRLKPSDFRSYDIEQIAASIRKPSVQRALMHDLERVLRADRNHAEQELQILKYFSHEWEQELPDLPGVDWREVQLPRRETVERMSYERRHDFRNPYGAPRSYQYAIAAADPGIQWKFVWMGFGTYIGLCMLFGFMQAALFKGGEVDKAGESDPITLIFTFLATFLTGLIVGIASPGRTLKEPGLGIGIGLLMCCGVMGLAAPQAAPIFAIGLAIAFVIQFGVAMLGAWIGEAIQEAQNK